MASGKRSLINQPLLDAQAVSECMQQGHHWHGDGLPWPMRESQRGRSGDLNSRHQGNGIDFSETRPYQPGDEPRHINWRATARTGRPQVRVFHEELAPTACFLIDRRATMRFGTRCRLKVTQAARLGIFLATWEARRGAEIAGLILDETPHWRPAVSGQQGIHNLAQLAISPCPPITGDTESSIDQALALLAERLPAGSHLYLLSDFYDLQDEITPRLYQLGQQHRVWAINVADPAEQQLPKAGKLQLVWNHTNDNNQAAINSQDSKLQQWSQLQFIQRQRKLKDLFSQADITFSSIDNGSDNIADALQSNF